MDSSQAKVLWSAAVRFSLSQVGNDPAAKASLENFLDDPITQYQLNITSSKSPKRLDTVFLEYQNSEAELDRWILDRLSNNIRFP
ncbi:hypothetical protein ASPWEDRAFT_176731 [Aspergillus wentii DTO 134E9]|uniref:Uncharacterized protein n=1 Tax=Aspergillus wentii DTO 134E9 TaxID=1073089 RepID=A0A1L9R9S4_ASPWE|nr:uncharacterized protein ASPWEDRAFT_176731 [Aspergillus wentii DTO 134E9]KAI9926300.1 hypothetical protein MW887_004064 [Aspergillus wentii]OJJ31670.1 hypothetical protein ASPWEDRAFT_176731 [Aspergillus wentii DTO 134E9]